MSSKMIYIFSLFSFFTLATASEKSASKEAECEKVVSSFFRKNSLFQRRF